MILAAAIRAADGSIWTLPPPARHHDIGSYMIAHGEAAPYPSGDNQGFLVSHIHPRFPDRAIPIYQRRLPAKRIAELSGQILPGQGQHRELFSEDLW